MALPTVRINNSTGSDTAASGAGPGDGTTGGSAVTGANASTDGTGLIVTLPNANLSNVAVDGSHLLWLDTASGQQYGKITAKADSGLATANVTVATAFGLSLSGLTYAIGGKRSTLDHADTRTLFADFKAGWTVEIEHTGVAYTLTSSLVIGASGDTTDGAIDIVGTGASRPTLTSATSGVHLIRLNGKSNLHFHQLTFTHTGATRGVGLGPTTGSSSNICIEDCLFDGCYNGVGIIDAVSVSGQFSNVEVKNSISHGLLPWTGQVSLYGCHLHHNGGDGIAMLRSASMRLVRCILAHNTSHGLDAGDPFGDGKWDVANCTFYNNTDGHIKDDTQASTTCVFRVVDTVFYQNTGGPAVNQTTNSNARLDTGGQVLRNNAFGGGVAGNFSSNFAGLDDNTVTLTANPFTDPTNGDYTPNSAAGGGALLTGGGLFGADIGAVQSAASGGGLRRSNWEGGFTG